MRELSQTIDRVYQKFDTDFLGNPKVGRMFEDILRGLYESVLAPGTPTHIHFDIHMNINMFTNHQELGEKLLATIQKNKEKLFREGSSLVEEISQF